MSRCCAGTKDHPRRCGENGACNGRRKERIGSPPQVRGKRDAALPVVKAARITPAGAGKTPVADARAVCARDHPRRCGENSLNSSSCRSRSGSPPQVRGKLSSSSSPAASQRITPAGAGKTSRQAARLRLSRDHPRRCGENRLRLRQSFAEIGSPPQVRGKPLTFPNKHFLHRITPAGAGKTDK